MIISEDLLLAYGAVYETYQLNDIIFQEAAVPGFYFQLVSGIVKLNNYHEDGKEFVQNVISAGESFGESFLFNDRVYPVNAVAKTDCKVLKLSKPDFHNLLQHSPDVFCDTLKSLSDALHNKYIMLNTISSADPSLKIKTVIDCLKDQEKSGNLPITSPLNTKQVALRAGIHTQTVTRAVKKNVKQQFTGN